MVTHFLEGPMKKISLLLMLMCSSALRGMDDGSTNDKTVVTVELDGVVSTPGEVGVSDFVTMGTYFGLLRHAWLLTRFSDLGDDFSKIEDETHGMGNIFHKLVARIHEKYEVDLSRYTSDLVKRSTKPIPNPEVINLLRKIREGGNNVMGVTDMDWFHYKAYRAKMDDKGVDLKDVFASTVVTCFHYFQSESSTPEGALWTEVEKGVYMVNDADSVKPSDDYFKVAGEVVKEYNPGAHRLIHVDTTVENVTAAGRNGFTRILFPSGSADELKKSLQHRGISTD